MSTNHKGFLFIGDAHLSATRPGRRTDDDFLQAITSKLRFSLSLAREKGLLPIFMGGLTAKAFDVKVLSALINAFQESQGEIIVLSSPHDHKKRTAEFDHLSTLGILDDSNIATIIKESGTKMQFSVGESNHNVTLHMVLDGGLLPEKVDSTGGTNILLHRGLCVPSSMEAPADFMTTHAIGGCDLVVVGHTQEQFGDHDEQNTKWLIPGPLTRMSASQNDRAPQVWSWTHEDGLVAHDVPHAPLVIDTSGIASEYVQAAYASSDFASMLKEEADRIKNANENSDLLRDEINTLLSEKEVTSASIDIIQQLKQQTGSDSDDVDY